MQNIRELEPSLIWNFFNEILKIPRPSKKEEKIIAYLEKFAVQKKLEYKKDSAGNILIIKNADKGFENLKTVVLQSHVDMVCEKNSNVEHNFEVDPIPAFIEDGWIRSKGTTLGADNGIGIAAQLAILSDSNLKTGPIECLFTVDEESGLTGAFQLEKDFMTGKVLLNLDSEDEGELFIGCAGGMDTLAKIPFKKVPVVKFSKAYRITISGLKGGHSGDDINKGLGNSNKILTRLLWNVTQLFKIKLFDFQGGNLKNAIPREAYADVVIKTEFDKQFIDYITGFSNIIRNELLTEPDLKIDYKSIPVPETVLKKKHQKRILNSLHACPNGVIEMSTIIPGLVETSSNLASVKFLASDFAEIITSQRSMQGTTKKNISDRIRAQFELANAEIFQSDNYPEWTLNKESKILQITVKAYEAVFKRIPIVRAIHAGLECGLFLVKYPDLDMISFGPTIRGAHSPDERLEIESVGKFWKLLVKVLNMIPEK
jgi:dipeptidase D